MVAAAAAALSSSAAFAEPVYQYNWSGFYIGANGGAAWSPDRPVFVQKTFMGNPFYEGTVGSRHVAGGFGGGQIGYNAQWGNWVFGLEADAEGGSIHGASSNETTMSFYGHLSSMRFDTRECLGFVSTFRGRVGYSWNDWLIYGTAGGAVGETNIRIGMTNSFGADAAARTNEWRGGFAVGGGGEFRFSPNWSAKFEYQYIDLGSAPISGREFVGGLPWNSFVSTTTRFEYHTVRLGVNYRFGAPGVY
jgi:outer membrane immunogenic protein